MSDDWRPAAPPATTTAPQDRLFAFVGWLLPVMSGLEMCRRLRDRPATAPGSPAAHITLVPDSDDQSARRRALEAGADDYTLAPLDPRDVIARLRKTLCDHAIEDPIRTVYGVGYVFDTVD